jgi:serine phosphatase RsbU (regulator of sigma subunit)
MPWLVALDGEHRGRRFPLGAQCLIGRGHHNHVVLDDARASRQHAKISPEGGSYLLYDLKSANGTYVNQIRIEKHVLNANDLVKIGSVQFRFESEPVQAAPLVGPTFREATTAVGLDHAFGLLTPGPEPSAGDFAAMGLHEMEDADRKLRTLYGILFSIASTLDANELLEQVVRTLFDIFPAAKLIAVYLRTGDGKMVLRLARSRTPGGGNDSQSDVLPPPKAKMLSGGLQMQAPMFCRGQVEGVLHVRGSTTGRFTRDDLRLLNGLAAYTALGLENIRMHQASSRQQRLEQDLALAQRIQKSFLPLQFPVIDGIEFVAEYQPAYTIGGDFYDVFWQSEDRVALIIGDVAGKGVAAALLMARIVSDLRVAALSKNDPSQVLSTVNHALLERQQHDHFVTVLYLTLDVKTREVVAASAGHPHLLLRRKSGQMERAMHGGGPPVGVFDDARYDPVRYTIDPGDLLLLFTDGFIEAADVYGRQFGVDRVAACLRSGGSSGAMVISRLLSELKSHIGAQTELDDLTVLACGIAEEEGSFDDARDDRTPVE